jgi:hypothetical protein
MRHIALLMSSAVFLFSSGPAARLFSQTVYGNIVGLVTDPSGAAIPGAKVTIRDIDRNVTFTPTTNESGNYSQQHLIVGRYHVKIEAEGFGSVTQENIQVSADSTVRFDGKLQLGTVSQDVVVTSEAVLLKTERSDVAITYNQRAVNELPMLNRRFSNFQFITP